MEMKKIFGLLIAGGFLLTGVARADLAIQKAYKEVYSDSHPKCASCHTDAMPKKADGQHELNEYGKALQKELKGAGVGNVPTADDSAKINAAITKVGKIEDFKGK